jgi:hypothetical protein
LAQKYYKKENQWRGFVTLKYSDAASEPFVQPVRLVDLLGPI